MALDHELPSGKHIEMYGNRLKKLREQHGYTLERVAGALDISTSQVQRFENETREPRYHEIAQLAQLYGVPVSIFFSDDELPTVTQVPLISWVSAGSLVVADIVADFRYAQMISVTGLDPGDWIALKVEGDSMNLRSPPGSIILVNRAEQSLVSGKCYVIADEDGSATYKRFRADPMRFEPMSTNLDHEPIYPDNDPIVIGRVRRTLLEM